MTITTILADEAGSAFSIDSGRRIRTDDRARSWQKTAMRCGDCGTPFFAELPVNTDVSIWAGALSRVRCPSCGSKSLFMGLGLTLREDRAMREGTTLKERLADWDANGDTGLSSRAVVSFMTEGAAPSAHPHDWDDLRRVILLIDRIPEWRTRMRHLSPFEGWSVIGRRFSEIVGLATAADPEVLDPQAAKDVLETAFRR